MNGPRPAMAALDVPTPVVEAQVRDARLRRGRLEEQRHQFLDLDTDSTCRPQGFVCPACPPKEAPGHG